MYSGNGTTKLRRMFGQRWDQSVLHSMQMYRTVASAHSMIRSSITQVSISLARFSFKHLAACGWAAAAALNY